MLLVQAYVKINQPFSPSTNWLVISLKMSCSFCSFNQIQFRNANLICLLLFSWWRFVSNWISCYSSGMCSVHSAFRIMHYTFCYILLYNLQPWMKKIGFPRINCICFCFSHKTIFNTCFCNLYRWKFLQISYEKYVHQMNYNKSWDKLSLTKSIFIICC